MPKKAKKDIVKPFTVLCPYCGKEGNEVVDEETDWIDGKIWLVVSCDHCDRLYEEEYNIVFHSVNKRKGE